MNAIGLTNKSIFERLYLVAGRRSFVLSIDRPCASAPPTAYIVANSRFCYLFVQNLNNSVCFSTALSTDGASFSMFIETRPRCYMLLQTRWKVSFSHPRFCWGQQVDVARWWSRNLSSVCRFTRRKLNNFAEVHLSGSYNLCVACQGFFKQI